MEFDYEHQMAEPAKAWLVSKGLVVKREFPTPWGICDLVGCALNKRNVRKRLRLRQTKPIGSHLRVLLLAHIPEQEEARPITLQGFGDKFLQFLGESRIIAELDRLERDRFIRRTPHGSFYKVNGWMPLHKKLIALELKLSRISDALNQAISNLEFADESFVGLPFQTARRLLASKRKQEFVAAGVGILGLTSTACRVLLRPSPSKSTPNIVIQTHCVERFWRTRAKDNSA